MKDNGQYYLLDNKDKAIQKKLTRDPTISDNQIAKLTRIPVKTVKRL